jgi:hypothetical protein
MITSSSSAIAAMVSIVKSVALPAPLLAKNSE